MKSVLLRNGEEIIIREVQDPKDFVQLELVQKDAWGMPDISVIPSRFLIAIKNNGGVVAAAWLEDEIVGYVLGYNTFKRKEQYHYSHHCAVKRKYQHLGIGFHLKLFQREKVLENGVTLIRWTFDPLQSKNAYFNFHKLGAINRTYKINYYGAMRDELNKGLESDRFFVEWYIDSTRVKKIIHNALLKKKKERIQPSLTINEKQVLVEGIFKDDGLLHPVLKENILDLNNDKILIEIPASINDIKKDNINVAINWRYATRKAFINAFNKGYTCIDFIFDHKENRSWHVLVKKSF